MLSIDGPEGIGKTRLLNEFAIHAQLRGTQVWHWDPDGVIGPMTRQAIRDYQRKEALPADGYADHALWKHLQHSQ